MVPASTPKVLQQLTGIIQDEHTPVSVAKRFKIYLTTTAPLSF